MLFSAGEGNTSFYLKRLLFKFWTFCVFEDPFGGLKTTYDDHLRLSGKRKDFLLVLTELFRLLLRLRCYERMSVQNWRLRSNRDGWPKISGRKGRPTNHSSQKTRLNDLSSGHIFLPFCHNARVWQTERQTDGQLSPDLTALHSMQRGKSRRSCMRACVIMRAAIIVRRTATTTCKVTRSTSVRAVYTWTMIHEAASELCWYRGPARISTVCDFSRFS